MARCAPANRLGASRARSVGGEPKVAAREPLPRLTLVGIVILLAGLGVVRDPQPERRRAESDLTAWQVGACVRITPERPHRGPCAARPRTTARSSAWSRSPDQCPASAQWWVARESDGFCVRRNEAPGTTVASPINASSDLH